MTHDSKNSIEHLHGVILAGGAGTRFWPLSRELSPKQILKFFGTESLICQAIARLAPLIPDERVWIMTNDRLAAEIRNHLILEHQPFQKIKYIVEPDSRNTAPAIGLAAVSLSRTDPDAIMAVLPSDHVLEAKEAFQDILEFAATLSDEGKLVTLGLRPSRVETGFGYIKAGQRIADRNSHEAYAAEAFVEKPDRQKAEAYIADGSYYWNAGVFVLKAKTVLAEIERLMPALYETLRWFAEHPEEDWLSEEGRVRFGALDSVSIDYGVMEKSPSVVMIPMDVSWSDVGSFTALADFYDRDDRGNVIVGNAIDVDSKDSIVYADKRLVATIGLENLVVIDTHDATLVCPKDRCQDVRKVAEILKSRRAEEYLTHRTVVRPWGCYTLLDRGPGFKIKLIEIKPGAKLSHQLHQHRSEHWVVVSGAAKITKDGEVYDLHVNESTFIPMSTAHRLENPGRIPLKVIEVQNGEYLEEDDIVRMDDDWERETPS